MFRARKAAQFGSEAALCGFKLSLFRVREAEQCGFEVIINSSQRGVTSQVLSPHRKAAQCGLEVALCGFKTQCGFKSALFRLAKLLSVASKLKYIVVSRGNMPGVVRFRSGTVLGS